MRSKFLDLCRQRIVHGYQMQHMPSKFDNIVIGMSGGVDSSVCAALFADYPNIHGVYMKNWGKDQSLTRPEEEECYEKDWKDAVKVGKHLNIPVELVNFERDYWNCVFEPMLEQYGSGFTPNPDVGCNEFVKFGSFVEHLDDKFGKDNYWLVMGHYARVLRTTGSEEMTNLLRGFFKSKDQSYYLSQVSPRALNHTILPIGNLTKPEVRNFAAEVGLHIAKKPDSQGICFVNNSQHGKFKNFLEQYIPSKYGNIVTVDEHTGVKTTWGKHEGLWSYTIGQKIGISLPQGDPNYKGAWFVAEKDLHNNEIVIVRGRDNPKLFKDKLTFNKFKFLSMGPIEVEKLNELIEKNELFIQYRSLQRPVMVVSITKGKDDTFTILLEEPQRAVAPGQYCCLYSGERVLGSGIISK